MHIATSVLDKLHSLSDWYVCNDGNLCKRPIWLIRHYERRSILGVACHTRTYIGWDLILLNHFFSFQADVGACLDACYNENPAFTHFDFYYADNVDNAISAGSCFCQTECAALRLPADFSAADGTNTYAFNGGKCFGVCSDYNETVSISKTHAPKTAKAGGILKYVLVLENTQKIGNITDVGVQVQLPEGTTYLSSKVSGFKPALAAPEVGLASDASDQAVVSPYACV